MPSYDKTILWQRALAARVDDPHAKERERLRVAYENVRTRARPLAESIARDLPDYTVHDITHSDALWEYADLIAGGNYPLNPCEVFILGCTFLLHDLGMGLAAYPEGVAGLKKLPIWKDSVADLLRKCGVDELVGAEVESADAEIQKSALGDVLRRLHAERAEELALIHWDTPKGHDRYYLIEDAELRDSFGPIIGRISYSHWWPVERLISEFPAVMGAQIGFPSDWTVDPLKLACILRCADCAHIDERRAPAFLRALRQPDELSDEHWKFQAKLYQPRLEGDRLVFTAKSGFSIEEVGAWWVCFDTLNAIDCELRRVDSLLSDTHRDRFSAKGVSQAEEPSRIAKLIRTDGWQPVDTRIRVSAVADLVSKLGGKELYGDAVLPPLREMIQNASDAVRARRLIDGRDNDWGEIRITTGEDDFGTWLQVEDTGVGMSLAVLTGPLLDFGTSFWGSSLMRDQLPGLASKGFQATGRFGIGFFSLFMWGERVEVTTQRFDRGRSETFVLSFRRGLKERPLLRQARREELILDGGTRVKVWLSDRTTLEKILSIHNKGKKLTMVQICAYLAPCVDVTILSEGISGIETAVKANDWLTISDDQLLKRIMPQDGVLMLRQHGQENSTLPALQIVKNAKDREVGRVAVWNWEGYYHPNVRGIVTAGGLRAGRMAGIIGVLVGTPGRAARDFATPIIPVPVLEAWARKEMEARLREGHPLEVLAQMSEVFCALGIEPLGLPVGRTASGWVNLEQIVKLTEQSSEILLVQDAAVELAGGKLGTAKLNKGVLAIDMAILSIVMSELSGDISWREWPPTNQEEVELLRRISCRSVESTVIRTIARAWGCTLKELVEKSSFTSNEQAFEREVGTIGRKTFSEYVHILRRPQVLE